MPGNRTVVLIGGAPGVGKSTLGRGLAARTGAVSLTLDDVMVGVRALTDHRSRPELHPIRSGGGHVPYFTGGPPQRLIDDALELERATWPVVEALAAKHLRDSPPIVIDWWLLRPSDVVALDQALVGSVWIHIDPDVLWDRERRNTGFVAGSPDPERMLENFMHRSLWRNELVVREADELGLAVLRLDGSEAPDVVVDLAVEALRI